MDTLLRIQSHYQAVPRPTSFGNPSHCSECAEHNETLMAHTPETISFRELGNPGWDPICYLVNIDQFRYYLPALARLSRGKGDDYYLSQFLFHLNESRVQELEKDECDLLADFLEDLVVAMPEEIEDNLDADELLGRVVCLRG
jgi:hypothetical protein